MVPPYELPEIDHVEGVTVVRDRKTAARALEALYAHKDEFFACDTEVADIDVKAQGPVGNGKVSCCQQAPHSQAGRQAEAEPS